MVTRREFVLQILAIGAGSTVSSGKPSTSPASKVKQKSSNQQKPTYVHVAISGDMGSGGDALGALFATDLVRHQAYFERLRLKHKYYLKLKYHSTNRYQLSYALDTINYFFNDPDLSFIVSLFRPKAKEQINPKEITSDLTDTQVLEHKFLQLLRTGLALRMERKTVATDRSYIDIVSPGMGTRRDLKKYAVDNVTGLFYIPTQVVDRLPQQRVPKNIPTKKGHTRKAPNNIAEVGAFLTGYAGSFLRADLSDPRGQIQKALAAKLEIDGKFLEPLEKNRKFRVVWTSSHKN
jgi:hypothetical protein